MVNFSTNIWHDLLYFLKLFKFQKQRQENQFQVMKSEDKFPYLCQEYWIAYEELEYDQLPNPWHEYSHAPEKKNPQYTQIQCLSLPLEITLDTKIKTSRQKELRRHTKMQIPE